MRTKLVPKKSLMSTPFCHHMHREAPESTTISLSSGFIFERGGKHQSKIGEKNVDSSYKNVQRIMYKICRPCPRLFPHVIFQVLFLLMFSSPGISHRRCLPQFRCCAYSRAVKVDVPEPFREKHGIAGSIYTFLVFADFSGFCSFHVFRDNTTNSFQLSSIVELRLFFSPMLQCCFQFCTEIFYMFDKTSGPFFRGSTLLELL